MKNKNLIQEKRTCIHCGTEWTVTLKKKSGKIIALFCKDCLQTLTKQEKQWIYRNHSGKYREEERICIHCNKTWTVQVVKDFISIKQHYFCNDCCSTLSRAEKDTILREKIIGFHEKEKLQRRKSYKNNIIKAMYRRARSRAIKNNLDFSITISDIVIPDKCPLLEVPFVLGEKGNYEFTPTIDRIDNSKGYTKDNIWVITKKANSMKNSASFDELNTFCTNILRYSLNSREYESTELQDKEPVG